MQEIAVEIVWLFIHDNINILKNFYLKDDHNGKLLLEVIIDNFLDTAATVDVPTDGDWRETYQNSNHG